MGCQEHALRLMKIEGRWMEISCELKWVGHSGRWHRGAGEGTGLEKRGGKGDGVRNEGNRGRSRW